MKISNQVFQRAIFNFFQFPWCFDPGFQFFYHFLSNMSWIISKWQEIVKIFLWWPNLASKWSNMFQLWPFSLKLPGTCKVVWMILMVKEKLVSDVTIFFWSFQHKTTTRCWEFQNLTQFEQERGGLLVRTLMIICEHESIWTYFLAPLDHFGHFFSQSGLKRIIIVSNDTLEYFLPSFEQKICCWMTPRVVIQLLFEASLLGNFSFFDHLA